MIPLLSRKTSFLLVFGLFFIASCSSLNKTESNTDSPPNLSPLSEIERINRQIDNNGNSELLLLKKTRLFIEAAQNEALPSLRKPLYKNARTTSSDAESQFSRVNTSEFSNILTEAWSFEHNNGVRLLQADSDGNGSGRMFERAIAHLENAIILQPDSLSSYNVLATAFYSNGLYSDAINVLYNTLEINLVPEEVKEIKEKQAFIYLESGNTSKAVSVYEDLSDDNNLSITTTHGLVNAYILDNQPQKAAQLLQNLTEEYPDQISYKETLASVKYKVFKLNADILLADNDTLADLDANIDQLLVQLTDIKEVYESMPDNSLIENERLYTAAGFYTNGASYLEDVRTNFELNDSVSEILIETENEYLNLSLKYWEQLAELNPDNVKYLYSLYTIYNKLEMNEEAEKIEQSFNF